MPVDHLEHLEATINRLLERHEKTKREKEQLQKKLEQKESEWHHLRGQIRQYERERIEFKEKLDKIIGQFAGLNLSE
jgi:predicted nuclease with TOPRIM domain